MITIVTDSSVYVKKSEAKELGLRIVPLQYRIEGRSFYESYSDSNGDFESRLWNTLGCSTSQPNRAAFLSCFKEELAAGNQVLCITISSRLSGTFSSAFMTARQMRTKNIAVFDSHLTAGGLYLLVKEARALARKGYTLEQLMAALPAVRDRIMITFSVEDIMPLRNSGRIGFARLSVATILNIRPILQCKDGAVVADGTVRGNIEVIKRLLSKLDPNVKEAVINYIGLPHLAANLYTVIKKRYPKIKIKLRKLGPVLSINLGLHVVAVSSITKGNTEHETI